jgi:hypothetical protein
MENSDSLLESYKQQYLGKTYQWVRPINNEEVGDIVRVVNVKKVPGGPSGAMYMLVFHAGTPVNLELIGHHLTPHNDPSEPPVLKTPLASEPAAAQGEPQFHAPEQAPQKKSDIFALFEAEEKSISMSLKLKMPDIALLKMMYKNAADKDKFLGEVAAYVISSVTPDVIKESIEALLNE